jgi:alpha-tubulin suppressor-like RCC1 family protein
MKTNILLILALTACTSPDAAPTDSANLAPATATVSGIAQPTFSPVSLPSATPTASATPTPTASPTATPNVVTASQTVTNSDHSCSIMSDGTVDCTGTDTYDQAPAVITGLHSPAAIAIGTSISCVIDSSHDVYCWGAGQYIGNGSSQSNTATPVQTLSTSNVTALAAYGNAACAIAGTNTPYCWGSILAGSNESIPTEDVSQVSDTLTQIAVGNNMKCVLGAHLWCWNGAHTIAQQDLWSGSYTGISTNTSGQICVAGTVGAASVNQCYSSIAANGQL